MNEKTLLTDFIYNLKSPYEIFVIYIVSSVLLMFVLTFFSH